MTKAKQTRHKWQKIADHRYRCERCVLEKFNVQGENGLWETIWTLPDGREVNQSRVPMPCEADD